MKRQGRLLQSCATAFLVVSLVLPVSPAAAEAAAPPPVEQQSGQEQGVVRPGGAEVYDVPGGAVVGSLEAVSFVTIHGRTADSVWLVISAAGGATGWVQAKDLIAYNVNSLPVMMGEAPAAPAVQATGAPAAEPSATPLPPTSTFTPTPLPPTATPTKTPTPVPPTPTPTPVPPTATPTRLAVLAPNTGAPVAELVAVVGVNGADLFDAPDGAVQRTLPVGSAITLVGRNEDGQWLQTRTAAGATGWVTAEAIVAFNTGGLPVTSGAAAEPTVAAPAAETAPADDAVAAAPEGAAATATATPLAGGALSGSGSGALSAAASATAEPDAASGSPETLRPTPVADGRPIATVLLAGGRLNVRSGPGTAYTVVAKALPREQFVILGRTGAGDWLQVELLPDEGGQGWLSAQFVESSVPIDSIPVSGESEGASLLPTPTSTGSSPAADAAAVAPPASISTGPTGLSGMLAFQDGRNNIYAYNLDKGELRTLTQGYDPAISPDGRTVAFVRGGGADNGIYTIGIDGSNERKIWGEGEILRSPKWSPDGRRIVFSRLTGSYKCYDIQFIGCKSLKQLIAEFPFLVIPAVRRKFLSDVDRLEFPNWGISRVASDGSGDFRDIAALDSAVAPDWNAAGIVYQSNAGIEITVDEPEGNTRAVFQEDWDHDPDWQPNGGYILYQSKEGSHWEIWRITSEGTGGVALTRPETTLVDQMPFNVAPAWSFDGQQIVYLSSRADDEEHGPWRLWVMNADGSRKRPLPIDVTFDYSFASEQVVDWGPPLQ